MFVWKCTENGRKQRTHKDIIYEFGNRTDEVREVGRIVGGEGWQEKAHNREEWKKLLRTARNRHVLHMLMEQMKQIQR